MGDKPYQPPESRLSASAVHKRRWAHVVVAFLSAIFVPALLAYGVPFAPDPSRGSA